MVWGAMNKPKLPQLDAILGKFVSSWGQVRGLVRNAKTNAYILLTEGQSDVMQKIDKYMREHHSSANYVILERSVGSFVEQGGEARIAEGKLCMVYDREQADAKITGNVVPYATKAKNSA
jgi:hypothetical protein